jgi:Putative peptidoglycan binding domain/Transglycosylase SLT domain
MIRLAVVTAVAALALPAGVHAGVNPQVAGLQVALRAHGLYLSTIDGIAGPKTVAAVHAFQREHGLPVGIAGARTRRALGPLGQPLFGSRTIRLGDFGFDVAVLQFLLTKSGVYTGALDGYMGRATAVALRRYQRRAHLLADAVVGPRTLAAIVHRDRVPVRATVARTLAPTSNEVPAKLDAWATRLGVDPHLVRALAWMESGYQTRVVSAAGARGVLQTLPTTRQYVETSLAGRPIPRTVDGDIEVGVLYLKHLLEVFHGDESLALAGWYEGERAVREVGVYNVTKPFVANVLALRARM